MNVLIIAGIAQLNRLNLIHGVISLTFYDVVNFRNYHRIYAAWLELILARKDCRTDAYSRDWQFATCLSATIL